MDANSLPQSGQELLAVTGSLMLMSVGAAGEVMFAGGVVCRAELVRRVNCNVGRVSPIVGRVSLVVGRVSLMVGRVSLMVGMMKTILTAYL